VSAIDTLRDALFGNPPSLTKQPSREGVLAAFSQLNVLVAAVVAEQGDPTEALALIQQAIDQTNAAAATFNGSLPGIARSGSFADRDGIPLDQRKRGLRFLVTENDNGTFQEWREYEWRLAGDRDGPTRTGTLLTAPQWCALWTEREKLHFDIVPFQGTLPAANVEQIPTALANIGELYQPRIYGFRAVALSTASPLRAMLEWDGEADGFTLSWGNFSLPIGGGIRAIDTQAFDYDAVRPLLFTGDSMLDGTWAASAAAELGRDAVVVAKYSSGAKQAYRLGVRQLLCTAAGNAIPASGTSVAVTSINGVAPSASAVGDNPSSFDLFAAHGFLNTSPGDAISTHCSEAGTWGGRHGVMSVPNGGTPSVSFTPDDGLGASPIDPQSLFVPDNLARLRTHEVTARLSQNYAFAGPGNPVFPNDINPRVLEDLQLIAAETVGQPFTVLGLSPQNNFTTGTPFYTALRYLNGTQANGYADGQFYQLFGSRYAIVTVAGVKYNNSDYVRWFGRDGSANDQADYDAGINPRSVMETTDPGDVHYNAKGEGLEKAFWILWRQQRKRPPAITSTTLFTLAGTRTQPAIYPEEPVVWTSEPVTAGLVAGFDSSVTARLDALEYGGGLQISSFTATPSVIEVGGSANVVIAGAISGTVTGFTVTDSVSGAVTATGPAGGFTATDTGVNSARTLTLTAQNTGAPGGTDTKTKTASITFANKGHAGTINKASGITSADANAMSQSWFATAIGRTLNFNTTADGRLWYSQPASQADPSAFKLGGLAISPDKFTRDHITATGQTVSYRDFLLSGGTIPAGTNITLEVIA